MDQRKRHDSLAPKGAFGVETAARAERAAAKTAELVARQPDLSFEEPFAESDPEVSVAVDDDDAERSSADLCADALIPSSADRLSVEDTMRALIDMRLERTRPSDDFGLFELQGGTATETPVAAARAVPPPIHSLAPIELAPAKAGAAKPTAERKRNPFPFLAAAAIALLGVGVVRRLDRAPETAPQAQAAAQSAEAEPQVAALPPSAAEVAAEAVAAQEAEPAGDFEATGVSESEDAILTLGTPTIVNVETPVRAKVATVGPAVRANKEPAEPRAKTVAPQTAAKAEAPAVPEAPSRDAIVAGFNSVRDEVVACANGGGGVAPIEATIVSDGRITHATVGGYYQGTPQGSCIARALRKARFAPFARESIKVAFPYTL
jgi:hypothetical protein